MTWGRAEVKKKKRKKKSVIPVKLVLPPQIFHKRIKMVVDF